MWAEGWRDEAWQQLARPWDVIIIGGGITGAGILREASRMGLRALLLEARDFAYGTSSRSSKMVHGGLRYLKNLQVRMTLESVHERQRLLHEARGLVVPRGFLLANYAGERTPAWIYGIALVLYDILGLHWGHRHYGRAALLDLCPPLNPKGLLGGYRYLDAQVDDARLVLRLIRRGVQGGGLAINYAPVVGLLRGPAGQVRGVAVRDAAARDAAGANAGALREIEVSAPVVINASGVWADAMRTMAGAPARLDRQLRQLRGSHLVFPWQRLPLARVVGFMHPDDGRPVFALPWEGVSLVGTTDVDHDHSLAGEPAIGAAEFEYLLRAAQFAFAGQELTVADVQGTFSGVRPVVNTGRVDPSAESREHVLWAENGLLTVAGGKLTTFRLMARTALRAVRGQLPHGAGRDGARRQPILDGAPPIGAKTTVAIAPPVLRRLAGRYGPELPRVLAAAAPGELSPIEPGLPAVWAEARWAAMAEGVVHLEDLMLRRLRLGLTMPRGGLDFVPALRPIVQPALGWSDARWGLEAERYRQLWASSYWLPPEVSHATPNHTAQD